MRELILVRHGRTEPERGKPAREWALGADAAHSCRALARLLKSRGLTYGVTSEEPKAVATGAAMAPELGFVFSALPGFQEQEHRSATWYERSELEQRVGAALDAPEQLLFGDETALAAAERFESALCRLPPSGAAGVVVTHGRVLTAFVAKHNRLIASAFWSQLRMPSFVVLRAADFSLREVNFEP